MHLISFIKSLCFGILHLVRTWTALFWRVPSIPRLPDSQGINMDSDDECGFDSTWEDDYKEEAKPKMKHYGSSRRKTFAAKDMQAFRHRIRELDDDGGYSYRRETNQDHCYNLMFYRGQIKSSPDNVHIKEFHQYWRGDYQRLEDVHSYIQWLFPIQEQGLNWKAHVLTNQEIQLFRQDQEVKERLVESYKLMLDFYGIWLTDERTGTVARAGNWRERFSNLNRYSHNNLRITRILKCLGTLGLKHYQAPLVQFFLEETLVKGNLQSVKQSVLDYFIFAVLDKLDRKRLVKYAFEHFRPREQFVWGPRKILSGSQEVQGKNKDLEEPEKTMNIAESQKLSEKPNEKNDDDNYMLTQDASQLDNNTNQEPKILSGFNEVQGKTEDLEEHEEFMNIAESQKLSEKPNKSNDEDTYMLTQDASQQDNNTNQKPKSLSGSHEVQGKNKNLAEPKEDVYTAENEKDRGKPEENNGNNTHPTKIPSGSREVQGGNNSLEERKEHVSTSEDQKVGDKSTKGNEDQTTVNGLSNEKESQIKQDQLKDDSINEETQL